MSDRKKKRPEAVDYKEFVRLWRTSSSVGDVAKKFGINKNSASAIAKRLRDSGVDLPKFLRRTPQPINTAELNKIAKASR